MEEGVWVPKTPAKSILARWGPVSVDGNWKNHVSGSFSTGTSHDSAEFNAMSSADSMDAAQALKERIANEFDLNKSPCELGFGDSSNGDCEDILAGKQGIENHDQACIDLGYLKGINGTEAHVGGMAESSGLMSSENSSRGVNSCGTILACLDKIRFTELLSLPVETLPAFETCATPWGGVGRMPGDGVCPTSYSKNDSSMNIPLATSSFAEFGNCVERKDNTEIYGFHGLNQDKHEDDDLFAINKDGNEKFRPSVRSASTGFSTPSKKGNARYKDDVNLNKQSRTKRKRYWPKVAVEGKLKKTPKPSTPKPSTPKPRTPKPPKHATCKKGSVEKRKYVRKNNLKGSTKPSKDIGVDRQTFDASTGCVLESGTPALNSTFSLENHECEYVQNNRITASARRALKFNGKDAGIIIHQYQRRKKKKDSSSHDTNSIVQQSKEDNESMVENSADMAFGFTQSKKWNKTTYMEERGATNDGTNQTGCRYNSMKVYRRIFQCLSNSRKLGPNFPKICKQRRMRRLKTTNFASFGNTAMYGTLQSIIAAEDGQRILKKRRLRRRKATKFGTWWSVRAAENEQTRVQPNNVSSTPIDRQLAPQFSVKNLPVGIESCDIKFLFTIANCNFVVPNYSGIMISPTIAQRLKAVNDPDSFKCVLSLTPFATTTKKRSNESTRRLNLGYTTLIPSCNQLPSAPCTQAFNGRGWNQAVLLADNKNMVTKTQFKMGLFLDNAVYGHNKMEGSPKDVLSTQKSIQDEYSLAFTDVIERLEGLRISNEHGQLIVYNQNAYGTDGGHGPVIPYNPKKRKPPPKVDIDQETMRVWKLLMENGGEDVEGEKAEDKEKWWEEQREVFRGRVDSFIARMHLIQVMDFTGDRRFLPWKGSVVDSVVGVFLTQNVSDHLSSSAFMSLTAKYPLRPTTNHKACDEDEEIACSQESVGSSIGAVEQTLDANSNGSLVSETKLDLGHQLVENNVTTAGREISDEAEDRTVVKNEFSPHNFVDSVIDGNPTSTSQLSTQTLDANSNGSLVSETKLDLGHQLVENNVTTAGREISDEAEDRTVVKDEFSPHDFVDSVIDGNPTSTSQLSTIEVFSGITEIVQLEETACLLNFSSCENGNLLFNESLVDCDLSRKLENEKQGASPNILFDANDTHAHVCSSSSQNPYSYIPLTPADLEADSLEILAKSTNTKTKDVGDIRKIIGCVESSGSETIVRQKATPRAQEATVDQCASLSKCQVLPECSSQTEVNRAKGRLSSKNHHGGSKIIPQTETPSKRKKSKFEEKQDNPINWDDLRKTYRAKETTTNTMDSLDWEEVRQATVDEVADAIKGRGQHRVLAGRIKEFLDRVVRDHGSLNLEWLRDVPPDKAKDYLLSFKGLGLKSVECVRLLSLHHHAFPVDVNVGRVAVRLGWVPLQPLPESLQIHLLEQYPLLDTIQVYLWPRLCTLDQRTLYELHYQMITFGKVFCRKRNPNCNACPMKGECRHFASAFASARLALPGPQEKSMVSSMVPGAAVQNSTMVITPVTESLPEATFSESRYQTKNWKPIIEHPPSPVPDSAENLERDIEDFYYDEHPPSPVPDSAENLERDIEDFYYESEDDIPTVRLDTEEFKEKLREFIYKSDILLEEGEMSNALVALTSEAASMSVPKLKQVSRLRTVHHVYELPDSHIILKELEKREPDDPSPYLLAIWNSGETSNSSKSPRKQCDSLGSEPCNEYTCSSCNNSQDFQTVSGTILIPCRTATRGSFPLNGTYFQVNEVFADYESSEHPLVIPRSWIWNLRRRTLYCGAYGSAIFRGLSMQEIQSCFWRGFVCVRAFNRKTRAPAHLAHRFHISTVIPKGKRKFTGDQ
ncbi:hypothetical protein CsSME_00040538 [Camellia sinensis var. sinensis]